jgi:hypothetical protein
MTQETAARRESPLGWVALGAVLGAAALLWIARPRRQDSENFDLDSVMQACDKAARKLEDSLFDRSA